MLNKPGVKEVGESYWLGRKTNSLRKGKNRIGCYGISQEIPMKVI